LIRVQCPYCHRRYRTELEAFGRTAVCTKCFQTFEIGVSRPKFEWKPTDLAEDSWIGVEPPEEKPERKHCIQCDAPLEPGAVRCLACGANQVTGLAEHTPAQPATERTAWLSAIPVRAILIGLAVAAVLTGAYRLFRSMAESAARVGDDVADQTLIIQATRHLREGEDAEAFARAFGARVTDTNLPRFLRLLTSGEAAARPTIIRLIGCGRITDVGPVVSLAAAQETAEVGRQALEAIGVRRLVALASQEGPAPPRESAARALCLLFDLKADDETLRRIAEPADASRLAETLNALCGPWPQGTGRFRVVIDRTASPFVVTVEQVGRGFFLRVGRREFSSSLRGERRFEIPIDSWCSATGTAVDPAGVRELMTGSVALGPVVGGEWEGTVRVTPKLSVAGPLPGFLPLALLERGRTVTVPIRLERKAP